MQQSLQLLIVEDSAIDTELLVTELHRAGFEPVWQRVDTEAGYLERLHEGLDLVISDYQLPQFSGLRALQLLKARGLHVPFIFLSGVIGDESVVEAKREGAAEYLWKDRLNLLGPAIRRVLERQEVRRAQ